MTLPKGSIKADKVWKRFRADKTKPLFLDQMQRIKRSVTTKEEAQYRWVLKEVDLDIQPGGTCALIGINGSGKTTMLKILSKATYQTAGRCQVEGRIGALITVTAGLQPQLSGRENVFLYGAVLGMPRNTIKRRFDEIVEFAEVSEAIDRQIKWFSLGMQMRLGFSIAAFLEPDVLLVDEVLSVGDANFQQKCMQRMSEVVRLGTTLVYVSHDLASVEASCDRAVWLSDAMVRASGPTKDVITLYRTAVEENAALMTSKSGVVQVLKGEINAADGGQVRSEAEIEVTLNFRSPISGNARFSLGISQGPAFPMFVVDHQAPLPSGDFQIRCRLGYLPLPRGHYSLWTAITSVPRGKGEAFLAWQPVISFDAFGPNRIQPPEGVIVLSPVHVGATWEIE